ncbi:MAG: hypothetical protein V1844_24970 [Pseudomonadota bacterium]
MASFIGGIKAITWSLDAVDSDLSVRKFAAEIKKKFPDENTRIDLTLLPQGKYCFNLARTS